MNPVLMAWNLKEAAVNQFTHFPIEILLGLNFQEAVLKVCTLLQ